MTTVLRPPTCVQARRCGDCKQYREGACYHPLAEWYYGFHNTALLQHLPRWPVRDPDGWCGWWQPETRTTTAMREEYGI